MRIDPWSERVCRFGKRFPFLAPHSDESKKCAETSLVDLPNAERRFLTRYASCFLHRTTGERVNKEHHEAILTYIRDFLEVPNPAFSGMPICPFAGLERRAGKIHFFYAPMSGPQPSLELLEEIRRFDASSDVTTMLAFDIKEQMTVEEAHCFAQKITDRCVDIDMLTIPLHPKDPFEIKGVRTRCGPYVMMLIQRRTPLAEAKEKLLNTQYYDNFDDRDQRIMARVDGLCAEHDAFFPLVWWTDSVLKSVLSGKPFPEAVFGSTCTDLTRNELHLWMKRWGSIYGWTHFTELKQANFRAAQEAVDEGYLIIATADGMSSEGLAAVICQPSEDSRPQMDASGNMLCPAHQPYQEGWLNEWPGGAQFWRHVSKTE
jgi:hypothetical protein